MVVEYPVFLADGGTVYPGEFSVTSVVGATTCQDIIVRDDNLIEDDMQRTLTLDVVDDNDLLGETTRHTLTIADNDGREKLSVNRICVDCNNCY